MNREPMSSHNYRKERRELSERLISSDVQQEVIDSIQVSPVREVLSPELFKMYENEFIKGIHRLKEGKVAVFDRGEHTTTVRVLESMRGSDNRAEEKTSLDDSPTMKLRNYFIIDNSTGKAWDVMSLCSIFFEKFELSDESQFVVLEKIGGGNNFISFSKDGIRMQLDSHKTWLDTHSGCTYDSPLLQRLFRESSQRAQMLAPYDVLLILHEFGHLFQGHSVDFSGYDSQRKITIKNYLKKIAFKLPFVKKTLAKISPVKEKFSKDRNKSSVWERNAHAFAFSVIRKLRDLGISYLRDEEFRRQAWNVTQNLLATYQDGYKGFPGLPFVSSSSKS